MMLLNLIGHLIGVLFIDEYVKYKKDFVFFDSLFLISIYSFFQVFVFPINKKYRVFIIPILTLLFFLPSVFDNDPTGLSGEFVYLIATTTSKVIDLFYYITYNIANNSIRIIFVDLLFSVGYSIYLLAVFSSFKYIVKCLSRKYPLQLPPQKRKNSTFAE
jgi:hypothetical protein